MTLFPMLVWALPVSVVVLVAEEPLITPPAPALTLPPACWNWFRAPIITAPLASSMVVVFFEEVLVTCLR